MWPRFWRMGSISSKGNPSAMLEPFYSNTGLNLACCYHTGLAIEDRLKSHKLDKKPTQSSEEALKYRHQWFYAYYCPFINREDDVPQERDARFHGRSWIRSWANRECRHENRVARALWRLFRIWNSDAGTFPHVSFRRWSKVPVYHICTILHSISLSMTVHSRNGHRAFIREL